MSTKTFCDICEQQTKGTPSILTDELLISFETHSNATQGPRDICLDCLAQIVQKEAVKRAT